MPYAEFVLEPEDGILFINPKFVKPFHDIHCAVAISIRYPIPETIMG